MTDTEPKDYTQQNRRAWNEIAGAREKTFPPSAFFAEGGTVLDERAWQAALAACGSLHGKRLVHLQCATGEETLSWANRGAEAYGVDISEKQVDLANQKAQEAGLPTRFFAADVYDLPEALPEDVLGPGFDLVYTGGGAIVWLPDLPRWAAVVASLLRPGGCFLLLEEHPLGATIEMEDGRLSVVDDYFRRTRPWTGSGWTHFQGGEAATENKFEFNWPVGDVVTALAEAGLVIQRLEEYPGGPEWRFGKDQGDVARLPGFYLILAHRPG
jgi:SAM-dependent methyltransferase